MLFRLSKAWSKKLAEHSGYDAEVMAYGLEVFLSTIINMFLLCFISLLLGILWEMLIYIAAFALMRAVAAGGYHAKNHIFCFIQYAALSLIAIYLSLLCAENPHLSTGIVIVLTAFSIFFVFKYAPVETRNRPISDSENNIFKRKSRAVIIILCFAILVFFIVGQYVYSLICSFAVFAESVSLLPILNKGEIKNEVS